MWYNIAGNQRDHHAGGGEYPAYSDHRGATLLTDKQATALTNTEKDRAVDRLLIDNREPGDLAKTGRQFRRLVRREQATEYTAAIAWMPNPTILEEIAFEGVAERATRKGLLDQRDLQLLRHFRHYGTFCGVARRLHVDRDTVKRHIIRIDRILSDEAGVYRGWYLCYLEDILWPRKLF